MANNTFQEKRYEFFSSDHFDFLFPLEADKISRSPLLTKWKMNRSAPLNSYLDNKNENYNNWTVEITDNPIDLVMCGVEVDDSCLSVYKNFDNATPFIECVI